LRARIIRGSESHLAVVEEVNKMKVMMGDLIVETIDGADHSVPITHAEEFEKVIREFIPI
jgi:coenzyme F420-reducing hydrogenase beta subunit